jgi:hypothetical protein
VASPQPPSRPTAYKGRYIGILILVTAQILIGIIHIGFGVWLLTAPHTAPFAGVRGTSTGPDVYSVYTVTFSLLTLVFAAAIWMQKRWGWIGTVAVAAFVIVADSLTLLDLPSVPGIPKFAGFGEISYSVILLVYLLQAHIRTAYKISR